MARAIGALLGRMNHPQARETIVLLVNDADPDISIRTIRAAGRQKNEAVVEQRSFKKARRHR